MAYFVFVNSVSCFVCPSGYVLWLMAYRKACELGIKLDTKAKPLVTLIESLVFDNF